jgi:hypothetical protein
MSARPPEHENAARGHESSAPGHSRGGGYVALGFQDSLFRDDGWWPDKNVLRSVSTERTSSFSVVEASNTVIIYSLYEPSRL